MGDCPSGRSKAWASIQTVSRRRHWRVAQEAQARDVEQKKRFPLQAHASAKSMIQKLSWSSCLQLLTCVVSLLARAVHACTALTPINFWAQLDMATSANSKWRTIIYFLSLKKMIRAYTCGSELLLVSFSQEVSHYFTFNWQHNLLATQTANWLVHTILLTFDTYYAIMQIAI